MIRNIVNFFRNTFTEDTAHEYVNLGLPSGTKWATCNLGAANPNDYGNYYAWAETEPKKYYGWSSYRWKSHSVSGRATTHYYDYGINMQLSDDAANANWGYDWGIPSEAQWMELEKYCKWLWDSRGYKIIGPNGNSIFLPAAGEYCDNELKYTDTKGAYWSSSKLYYRSHSESIGAKSLRFNIDNHWIYNGVGPLFDCNMDCLLDSCIGRSIRPVCWDASTQEKATNENIVMTKATGSINGHEYVDLGLPSEILWATCNVGAISPKYFGKYYAWGEITTKKEYSEQAYKYSGFPSNLPTSADVATVMWGAGWKIPTKENWEELKNNCEWSICSGGYKILGPNGNIIYLPLAGGCYYSDIKNVGSFGNYMSSSLCADKTGEVWCFSLDLGEWYLKEAKFTRPDNNIESFYLRTSYRYYGYSVRPVCSK